MAWIELDKNGSKRIKADSSRGFGLYICQKKRLHKMTTKKEKRKNRLWMITLVLGIIAGSFIPDPYSPLRLFNKKQN
jgi:hypothetical protein